MPLVILKRIHKNFIMIKPSFILFLLTLLSLNACKKSCSCEALVYESNIQNNYTWTETSKESSELCEEITMPSSFLDSSGNISYVRTEIECE